MISDSWKSIFKKEKAIFNQMVYLQKQNHANFRETSIELFFNSYFGAIEKSITNPPSLEIVINAFEIFLTLILKGYLKDPKGERETNLFNLLSKLKFSINENLSLTISYIINTLSKIKTTSEIKFLKRLEILSENITNIDELKNTLVVLSWLSGHPEYRNSALQVFDQLPLATQKLIKDELKIESDDLENYFSHFPFGNFKIQESNEIKYKIISGYPLLGGDFSTLPILKMGSSSLLVFSNEKYFELHYDLFGENVFLCEDKATDLTSSGFSSFWKAVVTKVFPESSITSRFETDYFTVVTIKKSYCVYVFYRVPRK